MQTREDLAKTLQIPLNKLTYFAFGLSDKRKYVSFSISKRSGGSRTIHSPIPPLKKIQKSISLLLKEFYQQANPVCNHGYGNNKNIISNAKFHFGRRYIFKCDIKDFYPSISGARIMGVLTRPPFSFSDEVAHTIALLTTYNGYLPQGSPCSPVISNIITRRLDRKFMKFAQSTGGLYTRYADDITISYNSLSRLNLCCDSSGKISDKIREIFEQEDFQINDAKTRILTKRNRQMITGIIINEKLNVRRQNVRSLRNLIFTISNYGFDAAGKSLQIKMGYWTNPEKYIEGYLNFLRNVKGKDDAVYLNLVSKYTKYKKDYKYTNLPTDLDKINVKVLAEGKTDYKHFANAIFSLGEERIAHLSLDLEPVEAINGWSELEDYVKKIKNVNLANLHIAIFDSDEEKINNKYPNRFHKITNNLYVFRLPRPKHLKDDEPFCIEMLFLPEELKRPNSSGRRIYLTCEFDRNTSILKNNSNIFSPEIRWNALIVDGKVFDNSNGVRSIGLSKNEFLEFTTQALTSKNPFNYQGFSEVFDIINEIVQDFKNPS